MADAVILDIADAVAGEINAELSYGYGELEAERTYVPVYDLGRGAADELRISVVPGGVAITALSRRDDEHEYLINVAIDRKVPEPTPEHVDPLVGLVEEVADLFRNKRLAGYDAARCVAVASEPLFDPDALDQLRVFSSVLGLSFRVARSG